MSNVSYGRSPVEIREEHLVQMTVPVMNHTRGYCAAMQVQYREILKEVRLQAEQILLDWEGSKDQILKVDSLYLGWIYAATRSGHKV